MKVKKINLKHPRFNKIISKLKETDFTYLTKDLIRPNGFFYYLSNDNGKIIAIGEVYNEQGYIFSYASVHNDYQNEGYSKIILKDMIKDHKGLDMMITSYSHKGFRRLRQNLITLAEKFDVNIAEEGILFKPETKAEADFLVGRY